jgi:hypothetical protein
MVGNGRGAEVARLPECPRWKIKSGKALHLFARDFAETESGGPIHQASQWGAAKEFTGG